MKLISPILLLTAALTTSLAPAQTTFSCDFESYSAGANIHGQLIGTGTWSASGINPGDLAVVSTAFSFDGTTSLLVADNGSNRPRASANFITAGFIPAPAERGMVSVAVCEDPNDGATVDAFTFNLSGFTIARDPAGAGKFVFSVTGGTFSLNLPLSTDTYTYTAGQWNTFALDFDNAAKTATLYINGGYAGMLVLPAGGTANFTVASLTVGAYASSSVGHTSYFDSVQGAIGAPTSTEWWSSLYPPNWMPGYKDTDGRFLHDFSFAGYHRGERPVPFVMGPVIDVTVLPYLADNTGATDATNAIQAAIDDIGAAGGGVVYLPAGTYLVAPPTGSSAALWIDRDNVVLRGAGAGQTFLLNTSIQMRGKKVVLVQAPIATDWFADNSSTNTTPLSRDIIDPTVRIPVTGVAGFAVGDLIVVRNDLTSRFVTELGLSGFTGWTTYGNRPGLVVAFCRRIVAIDAAARELIVDVPTRFRLLTVDNARVTKPTAPMITGVGLEDFSIGMMEHTGTGFLENDYNTAGTGAWDCHQSFAVNLQSAENCWLRRVKTFKPATNVNNYQVLSNGLKLYTTRLITVDSCELGFAQYKGGGGNGYIYTMEGEEAFVVNCSAEAGRHNLDFGKMHTSGNVFLGFYSKDSRYASDFHQYLSMSNLLDNTICDGDMLETRFRGAEGNPRQGQTSTQSVFWNTTGLKYGTNTDGSISLKVINSHQFERGYVIGTRGPACAVVSTDFVEGVGTGDKLVPMSLYLDQLARRDILPPVISLPAGLAAEATGPDGAVVTFTASATDDRDGSVPVTLNPSSGSAFPLGVTMVAATARDAAGNSATGTFTVTVRDTTAPQIESLTASRTELWPANHKMAAITLAATVSDAVDAAPTTRILSVTSNEPVDGTGDGDTAPDWEITGELTLKLRAERSGTGSGRIYTITVESCDRSGNASTGIVTVTVPHNR